MLSTRRRARAAGFTLVEVLVASVAGVLVLGGIYQLLQQNQKVYKYQAELAETQELVRTAMDTMVRDLRQAGADATRTIFKTGNPSIDSCITGSSSPYVAKVHVRMDLPRDCGGKPQDDDARNCPSQATSCTPNCPDGDTWDILDKNKNGKIDTGIISGVTYRGENEFGNGLTDDINPDEDVTYIYCPEGCCNAANLDLCPRGAAKMGTCGQIYRIVRSDLLPVNPIFNAKLVAEPLADYIDMLDRRTNTHVAMFEFIPSAAAPKAVKITLRGRTKDPDPQSHKYKYVEMVSQVDLQNLM